MTFEDLTIQRTLYLSLAYLQRWLTDTQQQAVLSAVLSVHGKVQKDLIFMSVNNLDGVGPVDNRPSTD